MSKSEFGIPVVGGLLLYLLWWNGFTPLQLGTSSLVSFLLLCATYQLWQYYVASTRDHSNPLSLPPGSYGWPIIGESLKFLSNTIKYCDRKDRVFATHLLGKPTILIKGSETVGKVLMSEHKNVRGVWPKSVKLLLGRNLANLQDPEHRQRKKLIYKAFSHQALARYLPKVSDSTQQHLQLWRMQGSVDIVSAVQKYFFKLSLNVLLGLDESKCDVQYLVDNFHDFIAGLFALPYNIPGSTFARALRSKQNLHKALDPVVGEKMSMEQLSDPGNALEFIMSGDRDMISKQDVIESAVELLFAGYDTTSSLITSLFFELGQRKDVVAKLIDECQCYGILQYDSLDENKISMETLSRMPYLNAVIKEALRLHPPVPGGFREVIQTFELEGYQIPKGWIVRYDITGTHKVSDLFTNKVNFDPQRWLEFNPDKTSTFHYLPFSSGARACVGKEFARLSVRMFLVHLVTSCTWTLGNPNPVFNYSPVLYPDGGLTVTFNSI